MEINGTNVRDARTTTRNDFIINEENEDPYSNQPPGLRQTMVQFPLNLRGRRTRKKDVISLLDVKGNFTSTLLFATKQECDSVIHQEGRDY